MDISKIVLLNSITILSLILSKDFQKTKIIITLLVFIQSIFFLYKSSYKNRASTKFLVSDLFRIILVSFPVLLYNYFDGGVWFYSFIGIIIWMSGFYFGEIIMWWGIWVLTIGSTFWYLGILGPLLASCLLLRRNKFK